MSLGRKIVAWFIGSIIAISIIVALIAIYGNYSDGSRVGTVIKISKKGYIFKTNEGQLNTGEINNGIWEFSIKRSDKALQASLDSALNGGYRTRLYYDEKHVQLFFLGDTKYFITRVERLE